MSDDKTLTRECTIHGSDKVQGCPGCYRFLSETVAAQRARIEELEKSWKVESDRRIEETVTLRAENDALRKAVKP